MSDKATVPPPDDAAHLPPAPEVIQMEVGLLQNLCEILYCPETHEAAIVDPAWEVDRLMNEAGRRGLKVTTVLVTHTHNDHIEGVGLVVEKTGAAVVVNPREAAAVRAPGRKIIDAVDGREIAIGKRGLRVMETPGHTVGGICYLGDGYVVTGDVLFVGSCGRTDFTGGDTAQLWESLQRLTRLPEQTRVYPGHDYGDTPTSTIAHEVRSNRFLRCATFDEFRALRERKRS